MDSTTSAGETTAQAGSSHLVARHRGSPGVVDDGRVPAAARRSPRGEWRPNRHWPALDGLRAVAVLAVTAVHADILPGGYLGVDVFFVLSGFLITSLLIGEWDKRGGRISFRDFYARRVLRLFPALACVIAASAALAVILNVAGGAGGRLYARATLGAIPWVAGFAGNWVLALHPASTPGSLGALGQTWSLAVEEQFYLAWPALFVLLSRRCRSRGRLALCLAVIAAMEMIYRVVMAEGHYSPVRIYSGTDTHSDGLLIGCAVAFWLASNHPPRARRAVATLLKRTSALGAMALALLFVFGDRAAAPLDVAAAVLATAAILVGVAMGQAPAAVSRLLCSGPAVMIGRRSYGLYLWQYVVIAAAEAVWVPSTGAYVAPGLGERRIVFAVILGAAVAASFIVAAVSYRFVELPALRAKRRFQNAAN